MATPEKLAHQLAQLHAYRSAAKKTADEARVLQQNLLAEWDKSFDTVYSADGMTISASAVRPTTIRFDEEKLQSMLTPEQWQQVTRLVVDQKLLEQLVVKGEIDLDVVVACSQEVARTPYIKTKVVSHS
jgi:hypothetical protein